MNELRVARENCGLSQRRLARRASLSFKGVQLMEKPYHDMRLSSLRRFASAVGLPAGGIDRLLGRFFLLPQDSVAAISLRIADEGSGN